MNEELGTLQESVNSMSLAVKRANVKQTRHLN